MNLCLLSSLIRNTAFSSVDWFTIIAVIYEMLNKSKRHQLGRVGGGGGVGGWEVGRAGSKPTPFIYLAFGKTDPFIYLIIWNVELFIYCPLFFCTNLLLVVRQISQSIHWILREQAASKNFWAKNMCICLDVRKVGPFHIGIQKNRVIHILFVEKREPIIYLAVLKKGAIRHAHP